MGKNEIVNELDKINGYLRKCMWMDFEFAQMNESNVLIGGRKDISYDEWAIEINFGNPFYVTTLFSWQLDNSKPFIELVEGDEMWDIINKYQVEEGNYIFKINAEDFETAPIVIASKSLKAEIINENPFKK